MGRMRTGLNFVCWIDILSQCKTMGKEDQDDETERNMANLRFRNPSSFCAHFDPPMSMMTTTMSSSQELDTDVARTDAPANENPRVNNRIKKKSKKRRKRHVPPGPAGDLFVKEKELKQQLKNDVVVVYGVTQEEQTQPEFRNAMKNVTLNNVHSWKSNPESSPSYKAMIQILDLRAKMLPLTASSDERKMWARKSLPDHYAIIPEIKLGLHDNIVEYLLCVISEVHYNSHCDNTMLITDASGDTMKAWLDEDTEKDPHTKIAVGTTLLLDDTNLFFTKNDYKENMSNISDGTFDISDGVKRMLLVDPDRIVFAFSHEEGIKHIKESEEEHSINFDHLIDFASNTDTDNTESVGDDSSILVGDQVGNEDEQNQSIRSCRESSNEG